MTKDELETLCQSMAPHTFHINHVAHWQGRTIAKLTLPNGMGFVLGQDPHSPVFAYQTWMGVGSKHENPQRTGLAHLFEHLMFKGTHKYPAGTLDRDMESRGGQTNAATYLDWTYYTIALAHAPDNLSTLVQFESDRLQSLALDPHVFASELEVVKNERRLCVEDSISARLFETLMAQLYTQHPYRNPVIGHMQHLENMTLQHAEDFYQTYYVPNNANVVLYGGFNWEEALQLFAQYYAPIPARPLPNYAPPKEPPQTQPRCEILVETELAVPQALCAFPSVPQHHPDYAVVEIIAEILTGGETGQLVEKWLYDKEYLLSISSATPPTADTSFYEIALSFRQESLILPTLQGIFQSLEQFSQTVTEQECEKAKNVLNMQYYNSMLHVDHIAETLGHHETNMHDFSWAFRYADRWQHIHVADVQRVASQLFQPTLRNIAVATEQTDLKHDLLSLLSR
jgi:zinc protease